MGVYQNLGIRKVALQLHELIDWIRIYHIKSGVTVFLNLLNSKKEISVKWKSCSPIYLRKNKSDVYIFKQVFLDQQYRLFDFPLKTANRIIDAGANIGLAAIYFTDQFPTAEIICIEPELNNFLQLQKNTASYKNIFLENAAVWSKEMSVVITNKSSSLSAGFMVGETKDLSNENAIPAITVYSLMKKYNWNDIDIVKLDVEGAEKEIFANDQAFEWLSKTKLLIIELHDNSIANCSKYFFKALESFEYEAFYHHENIFIHFKHPNGN
jgi:FkbM family methyltransferase